MYSFVQEFAKLKSMVIGDGLGYIQSSRVSNDYYDDKEVTKGTIVIRVAQEKFQDTMDDLGSFGEVTEQNISSQEITDQYFDTLGWKTIYEAERERLLTYLENEDNLDKLISLERKLSEVTYEIERLSGNLRKWDDLVAFSTITINMLEEIP